MKLTIIAQTLGCIIFAGSLLTACNQKSEQQPLDTEIIKPTSQPTASEAQDFLNQSETELLDIIIELSRVEWIYANFITQDTAALSAQVNEKLTSTVVRLANEAARFNGVDLPYDAARQLEKLKLALVLPAPQNSEKTAELAQITAELSGLYGKGKYCRSDTDCLSLGNMTRIMAESRDPQELLEIWTAWRRVSPPMRPLYQRQVELTNEGARELGYKDLSAMWRSKYDMPADDFTKELDRLWGQVKPLYESLHCHVRAKLGEKYGEEIVPQNKAIPAHLLGNMWAQLWGNIYPLVAPINSNPGFDLTKQLDKHGYDEIEMVKAADGFFTSLGFAPMPDTFWERSLFVKPKDRDVICHASAWNLDTKEDVRIKMCIQKTAEEFSVIHHEIGHNIYQRAYKDLPIYYQEGANDGFHEAIGDTIALSITPKYLKQIGLIDDIPDESKDIGLLLKMAMDKVAFLPFGLLVDQWRWKVFSGEITPEQYNQVWWELREKYQGVRAPISRSESDFDPGAKYHVPGNTPYTRYFLAYILQFQFHRALCDIAGDEGPIYRCSIYNNKAAGTALNAMLEMGSSRPWQDALQQLTGSREMDATAVLDYFAPLQVWLDKQNKDRQCGI